MQFTKDGTDKFGDITRELAQRGKRVSFGGQDQFQHFAIVLDNEIRSWPSIDFNENPNGISGSNGAQITGMAGVNEAKDLAIVLQTGALPIEFQTLEETQISATLGEDSLRQAWQAAIAGLVLVALFLLIFYRFLGLIAVLGLGDLRRPSLRRDPALRRDADAAGLRGNDPDDRCRGRREHRHLRANQGGVARR